MAWVARDGRGRKPKPGRLRRHKWERFLRAPDPDLLNKLYLPALAEAIRYDRCCSYFSSGVLSRAAAGFAALTERLLALGEAAPRPAVRLLVNEELPAADVAALRTRQDENVLIATLQRRFKTPKDALEKERLRMLAWLYKSGLLDIRVGVLRVGEGIVHPKFGLITDERGDSIVFRGSGNETAAGVTANYESFEVSPSWQDPVAYKHFSDEFEKLWENRDPVVYTVKLPDAIRLKLIKLAPNEPILKEPAVGNERQKAAMMWRFICAAPYLENGGAACDATMPARLWPHQVKVIDDASRAWPAGRLLCDEVGMGKTLEAIGAIRRLRTGRGVSRVLILVPAGLLRQWQDELREKGGLVVPLFDNGRLIWPDNRFETKDFAEALREPILVLSREYARLDRQVAILLAAEPWDLVVMDEAHAARRAEAKEGEFNSANLLLGLLRALQLSGKARGLMLLSATPMQINPWEPWDLLTVLGVGGLWASGFRWVREYYRVLAELKRTDRLVSHRAAVTAVEMMKEAGLDAAEVPDPLKLEMAKREERGGMAALMRRASPLSQRMHRNCRETLRQYYKLGLIDREPPVREVMDIAFDYEDAAERRVYDAVTQYIDRRFDTLERDKPGKGFVMTIYRRRASSSPHALRESLKRRRDGLVKRQHRQAADEYLAPEEEPGDYDMEDWGDLDVRKVPAGFPTDPNDIAAELTEVEGLLQQLDDLDNLDSKRDAFCRVLRELIDEGRTILVFSGYTDTVNYVREYLERMYPGKVGSYTGAGGALWDGTVWRSCSKKDITDALFSGRVQILVCNDAASEGLNLQAASAVVNYDMPWNPSRVEQRIGRVDRIGQKQAVVKVLNLMLRDSVDERVYSLLRKRCGLFEHFVGPMQPVLSLARDILLGRPTRSLTDIAAEADRLQDDDMAQEFYSASQAEEAFHNVPLTKADIAKAIAALTAAPPVTATAENGVVRFRFTAGRRRKNCDVAIDADSLARDTNLEPLLPESDVCRDIASALAKESELLPLVIGRKESADGRFCHAFALWVGADSTTPVTSFGQLCQLLDAWDGSRPKPDAVKVASQRACEEAESRVLAAEARALGILTAELCGQIEAARLRLLLELGCFLSSMQGHTRNLNQALYEYMSREDATARRMRRAFERLGSKYPEWPPVLLSEIERIVAELSPADKLAVRTGSGVDAALDDPRWKAAEKVH